MSIPVVDIFADILTTERAPIKQILLPTIEGSGNCNRIGDTNTYRIVSTGNDFPDRLIATNVMLVTADGMSVSAQLSECATKTLAKRALDFEFLGDAKKIDRHRVSVYSMKPHDIYAFSDWESRNQLAYSQAMKGIEQLNARRNPLGKAVELADILDEPLEYWRGVLEGVNEAPMIGAKGELLSEDDILTQVQTWDELDREVLTKLREFIVKHDLFRPMDDEQYAIQITNYRLQGIAAMTGTPRNPALDSFGYDRVLRLWNLVVGLFDEPTLEPTPEPTPEPETEALEEKKIDTLGTGTTENENKSPVSSAELSEAEVTRLVSAVV
jgi:hypothetical protein